MTQLIPLQPQTINGNAVETVSARELHEFLESKRQFADWIKNRISDYDFQENQDFICVSQKNETQRAAGQIGVAVSNEYYITLDMANFHSPKLGSAIFKKIKTLFAFHKKMKRKELVLK